MGEVLVGEHTAAPAGMLCSQMGQKEAVLVPWLFWPQIWVLWPPNWVILDSKWGGLAAKRGSLAPDLDSFSPKMERRKRGEQKNVLFWGEKG